MIKRLLAVFGLVELLVPRRFIEFWEGYALENPEDCSLKRWVIPVARLEGLLFLAVLAKPRAFSGPIRAALGWYGLMAALSPDGYLEYWTPLIYEDGRPEWKPWVVPATRVIGVCYVVLALFGWPSKNDTRRD
ncbi:hypothetical protein [Halalkalicoccus subterraneus]|uniref:hypothetical protein n=1 Tax=Halalkalicoccus subterraneus TaxID=2675002 RepID=UPI000EFC97EB|nr:hypothetical protein [Halalkalicoccus subterraneus]